MPNWKVIKTISTFQCTFKGNDLVGWKNIKECAADGLGYSEEKDIEFYSCNADSWVPCLPGNFGIYFPEDAHAPNGTEDDLVKVILKVAVNW